MKLKALLFATVVFFISCSNDKKTTEVPKQASTLKSDILIQSSAVKPFSGSGKKDIVYLTLSGKTILKSTATFKAVNENGEELHCETFPTVELIQPEYKTANRTIKEVHVRDIVKGFFVGDQEIEKVQNDMLAKI